MASFLTFKYGTGILYGGSSYITEVDPARGPSTGGNAFVITGSEFNPQTCDNEFTTPLSALQWTDISAGGGSIATGTNHLVLTTGAVAAALAGIESVPTFYDCQGEVRITIPKILTYPVSTVELLTFMLRVDASNYAKLSIQLDATDLKLICEVYTGGIQVDYYEEDWTIGLSIFKILRWGEKIIFLANGSEVYTSSHSSAAVAKYRVYAYNDAANYNVDNVVVEHFKYRPYVAWGDSLVPDVVVVSSTRIRGIVPPSLDNKGQLAAYSGDVDVAVVSNDTIISVAGYEYYFVDALKVIESTQFDVRLSFIDDDQIATPEGTKKGL